MLNSNCIHIVYDDTQEYFHHIDCCLRLTFKKNVKLLKNYMLVGCYAGEQDMQESEDMGNGAYYNMYQSSDDSEDQMLYIMGNIMMSNGTFSETEERERNLHMDGTDDYVQNTMRHF